MPKQTTTPTATKPNIYQVVTDRILASLKEGVIPWEKPWQAPTYAGGNLPRNFRTGKPYRGVNVMLLWSTPYTAPFWLTYKQAQELGGTHRTQHHRLPPELDCEARRRQPADRAGCGRWPEGCRPDHREAPGRKSSRLSRHAHLPPASR